MLSMYLLNGGKIMSVGLRDSEVTPSFRNDFGIYHIVISYKFENCVY